MKASLSEMLTLITPTPSLRRPTLCVPAFAWLGRAIVTTPGVPPKTHNLIYLLNRIDLKPDEDRGKIITRLSEANIATRYPDDIDRMRSIYTVEITTQILREAKGVLEWIKQQL